MKRILLSAILFTTSVFPAYASHIHPEKYYQELWCSARGISEYRLKDATRIDCLTPTHAIEFDFAPKWAEAVGQSLYYAMMTNKKPGIVLILENPQKDCKYYERIKKLCEKYNIDLWTISP